MQKHGLTTVLLFSFFALHAQQPTTLLVDADHRPQTSLNGPWHYVVDPLHQGWGSHPDQPSLNGYAKNAHFVPGDGLLEYEFALSPTLNVPGDWNSQKPNLFFYEGMLWYQKDFNYQPKPHTRVFLHFGAVNYEANVFVNDQYICKHEGGYTPFDCEVTSALKPGSNFVVVSADNQREQARVPSIRFDWWNYGGITREVSLIEVPESFIDDYSLQLKRGTANQLDGYVHVAGATAGEKVTLRIPELHLEKTSQTDASGNAAFSFTANNLELWSPDHPRLYTVEMRTGSDSLTDQIGFRTIEVKGEQILLNGKPIFLRGVCIHAEAPYRSGRAWSKEDAETLLGWAHDLHANFVRLAHYPHDENMTRTADKLGIMVWSEIPVYWGNDWTNPRTADIAAQQLHEMVRRDHNKASVILWSMSNETPISPERTAFISKLAALARQQDPTRLITSAVVTHFDGQKAVLDDPLGQYLDVLGYNEYIGWYNGKPDDAPAYTWENPLHKPLIMSEFGGGAQAGLHKDSSYRFSEEYQANLYQQQFQMLDKIPFLAGITPWVLMDFRSPMRQLPGIQDYYNRKGLISDKGEKKKAFTVLQNYYEQHER
ncbi:MAG TPA: glycoside hydrolase family 2 TIM barrel-domain containing protein [Alloacidobacterium sp.]|nr:glycoside hydrolase family 2 TIM barrel-domain containing protein [Alloacidobacterium sp.]